MQRYLNAKISKCKDISMQKYLNTKISKCEDKRNLLDSLLLEIIDEIIEVNNLDVTNPLLSFQALKEVAEGHCPELPEPQFHPEHISDVFFWQQWEMQGNNMQENLQRLVVQLERDPLNKKKLWRKIYD